MCTRLFYRITDSASSTIFDFLKKQGFSGQNLIYLKQHPETVTVNGSCVLLKTKLHCGDLLVIEVSEPPEDSDIEAVELPLSVVYEDDHILVVDKPSGMSIHPSLNHYRDTLANAVKYYFESKGIPFTYRCINRLDRDTSGLTIIAKHMFSASILYRQMTDREIHREYLAIVEGEDLPSEGVIDAPIARVGESIIEREVNFESGEKAVTHYKVLHQKNGLSLVSLWLETGRTHQIRVHMKYTGHPLIGDFLYNPGNTLLDRQALHSYHLYFNHPITKEAMFLEAPIPMDMSHVLNSYMCF